jgi:hypothetical protein
VGADSRGQAQDCFPTVQNAITPGEHFSPSTDRFGTCAFSEGADLSSTSPNLITGDSILVQVTDTRGTGGIAAVFFYGAIVAGPHAGKAPAPYSVGANGVYFVDLDDTYFRGGDVVVYFWAATDIGGGFGSIPAGLTALPANVAQAEAATGGLYEVSFLPRISWAPAYLVRIAGDAHGDLDPTPTELAASTQINCLLYYQKSNAARRSGLAQRTRFMYTLDRLGYRGQYDVYDVQGYGSTNNQLGGRASTPQVAGYALIIQDDGRSSLTPNMPDGSNLGSQKVNQAQWYRSYLSQGAASFVGRAGLWILGESTAIEKPTNPLFTTDMGLTGIIGDQGLQTNPDVVGQNAFTFADGCSRSFTTDRFSLNGGCPAIRAYDAANAAGTAVVTHRYVSGPTTGGGAIVMNKNTVTQSNTVWMGFGWFDISDRQGVPAGQPGTPTLMLASKVLGCLLPTACVRVPDPTGSDDPMPASPRVTALGQNIPNPFNPTTTIHFDLAEHGAVSLRVYDVAGRLVRTLVDEVRAPGHHAVIWNAMDDSGKRLASGIYFYRLQAGVFDATRKLVLLQ